MPGFGSWAAEWWKPVLFVVIAGHLTNVCVTLFLHRAQTHRSVKLHFLAALPMRLWLWMSTAIVTKEWVACHRKHHAFADREGDPHSPLIEGLRNIVLKGAFYYREAVRQPGVLEKYGKDTPNDWLERHILSRRSSLGIVVMLAVDVYLFGFFVGPLVWGIQMIWIPFWAAGIINGVGHAVGYRNFSVKDESRNISPIAIWLGGEELHNNHHADPHSARVCCQVVRVGYRLGVSAASVALWARENSACEVVAVADVACTRCGQTREGFERPPFPGEIGAKVVTSICRQCWADWGKQQTMLINHYGLDVMDPQARSFLTRNMSAFLFKTGEGAEVDTSKQGTISH